jgi:branched-chain amino acid aminotransferase
VYHGRVVLLRIGGLTVQIHVEPLAPGEERAYPAQLPFGRYFASRMYTQYYTPEAGWHDGRIGPYQPFPMDPAAVVFHYSQEIFEGLKAYRRPDGKINLFRAYDNCLRFNRSAQRMAMAETDPEEHFEAIATLVSVVHESVPSQPETSLYIRPTMIANDVGLGVHASKSYLHYIIAGPVGPYFAGGFQPVQVYVSREAVRAVRGGTGAAKTGGNYAASLYVAERVRGMGFQQVLWLDGVERRYVEEVGAMNIGFVYEGKRIVTPALSGSILPGITRDSLLRLAPDLGYAVSEERLDIDEVLKDIRLGKITEAFGIGTAAVIAPVGRLGDENGIAEINNNEAGPVARRLYQALTDIQYGRADDPYGWTTVVEPWK